MKRTNKQMSSMHRFTVCVLFVFRVEYFVFKAWKQQQQAVKQQKSKD